MTSKFQNRLIGIIVLLALGVIIFLWLLDEKKKYYQDECDAIPLIVKISACVNSDMLLVAT